MACCSYGYDPLGLGKDTAQVEKYREYELIHARWAMLAAAGIIIPEGLQVKTAPLLPCRDQPDCSSSIVVFARFTSALQLAAPSLCASLT